jgi:hypothetical protein
MSSVSIFFEKKILEDALSTEEDDMSSVSIFFEKQIPEDSLSTEEDDASPSIS